MARIVARLTWDAPVAGSRPVDGGLVLPRRPTFAAMPTSEPLSFPVDTTELYPYQAEGAQWLRSRRRALLGDEMGLGKTVQVLRALVGPTIVLCPAGLALVWRDECQRWRPDLRPHVLRGEGALAQPGMTPGAGELVIVSYDSLPEARTGRGLLPDANLSRTTLVLDEAHLCKNHKTDRHQRSAALARQCQRVWALTGTPLPNKPADLWGVLRVAGLAGEAFGSFGHFCSLFNTRRNRWGGLEWGDPSPDVAPLLATVMLRRERKSVLPDLPRKRYSLVACEVPEHLRAALDSTEAELGPDWQEAGDLPPFEMLSTVRAELASARIPDALEFASRCEEAGEPLVVFSSHRAPIEAFANRLGWRVILGGGDDDEEHEAVRAFQAGELRGLALTTQSGGVGITLTAARQALFVDLCWNPGDNAQAEDRLVRIGARHDSVQITRLVTDHPLDRRVLEILDAKQRLIGATVSRASRRKKR